jgi:hypothetical protein
MADVLIGVSTRAAASPGAASQKITRACSA